jgi:hypothetical protein
MPAAFAFFGEARAGSAATLLDIGRTLETLKIY